MSKVLFINGNAHGHVNPTLALVKELTIRGEEVVYYSTEPFRNKIEVAGAVFRAYGEKLDRFLSNYRPGGSHPFYTLIEFMLKMDAEVIPLVIEGTKAESYDYMIHDSMFGGGRILAQLLGLPAICSCTSFAMSGLPFPKDKLLPGIHPQLDLIYDDLAQLQDRWNLDSLTIMDIFFKKEKLNLVYTSKLFQPASDTFDESFKFAGPSILQRDEILDFEVQKDKEEKIVYISMGTINNSCMDFYGKCIEAFASSSLRIIMSIGNKNDVSTLGELPGNFIVRNHVPQLEVLKKADVFISHGGLNSVSEALYFGVPVIALPQANDQPMVAGQLVKFDAGIQLDMREVTPDILKESVNRILSDIKYKTAAEKIGLSFKDAGGYKTAADYIFEFKRTNQI